MLEITPERRRRGRRPADATTRRARVIEALAELESANVPFSMQDLAERAGISRATLYRDAGLRDLIGDKGDGPKARPVDTREVERLNRDIEKLQEEKKNLRRDLRAAERRIKEAEDRAERLDFLYSEEERARRNAEAANDPGQQERVRMESYAQGFAAGVRSALGQRGGAGARGAGATASSAGLLSVASRLPKPAIQSARRRLARVLHPDLFAKEDPATALLATELMKQINALAGGGTGEAETGQRQP